MTEVSQCLLILWVQQSICENTPFCASLGEVATKQTHSTLVSCGFEACLGKRGGCVLCLTHYLEMTRFSGTTQSRHWRLVISLTGSVLEGRLRLCPQFFPQPLAHVSCLQPRLYDFEAMLRQGGRWTEKSGLKCGAASKLQPTVSVLHLMPLAPAILEEKIVSFACS